MIYLSWDIGVKNLAYSIIHHLNGETMVIDFDLINLVDKYNYHFKSEKTKLSINEISIILLIVLENNYHMFKHCNKIFIENQPSFINPRSKTLSIIIYSYFIFKALNDNSDYLPDNVKLVSPLKKIPGYEKMKYSELKKLSVNIVTNYLKGDLYAMYKLNNYRKKDDITDSMLYILAEIGALV